MKKNIVFFLLGALAIMTLSCTKKTVENPTPDGADVPEAEKLGEYFFKDKTYDIYSTYCLANESYYILAFSPLRPQDEKTTVLMLAVLRDHDNVTLGVDKYYKNYDYVLRYESPKWLYPETIAPQSGSILVHRKSETEYSVALDVIFKDGTPLKLNYDGSFIEEKSGEGD